MLRFNIRVYGILINEQKQVLVTDELIRGKQYTKFPGGGLEYGEGTRDCLRREFLEEMYLKVEVGEHLYTTDFFQESAFHPDHQIISIYYYVKPLEDISIRLSTSAFDFDKLQMDAYKQRNEIESFRFINWDDFSEDSVSLPIDKIVAKMIKEKHPATLTH
jgi:ADP-ribose pyrophosphatase YjhB (NUDIX family)